jgi:HlyD family secretion protein
MRRTPLLLAALAALGAAAWWGAPMARPWLPGWITGAAEAAPRLRLAEADRGPITAVVAATGTVNPVLSVQVGSQLSGQIREMFADFNTRVTAGQPVARLDTRTIEARQAAAQGEQSRSSAKRSA